MGSHGNMSFFDSYDWVGSHHLCYDVIYSPEKTCFEESKKGAMIQNGLVLVAQAAEAYFILLVSRLILSLCIALWYSFRR